MRVFLAACGMACLATAAFGADLPSAPYPAPAAAYIPPAPPVYNWTGFYFGGNAGWGFAHNKDTGTFTGGLLGGATATGSGDANGAVAGGQMGFNYQVNALVVGVEGDFDWSGLSSNSSAGGVSQTAKIPWIATIRARAGVAADRLFVYGTGGVAFIELSDNVTATGFGTLYSASSTNVGWTAGVGAEFALSQNLTVRAEYLFVQADYTLSGPIALAGGNLAFKGTVSDNIVRAGINLKYP